MNCPILKVCSVIILLLCSPSLQAKLVTLTIGLSKLTEEIDIGTNEVAEITSNSLQGSAYVAFTKGDLTFALSALRFSPTYAEYRPTTIIAGSAKLTLKTDSPAGETRPSFITIAITPESFPPAKTVVIPQGGGANIALECSTNLIDWAAALPGVYTNVPSNKFFRIKADRL